MLREILTPSDTNNGGGFSVPRFCADSIFPRLNFNANPPMHNISIRDMHETKWEFWHIYRGTPRRHLLMTGWSKFINQKKLCAGDSVLFINHRSGEFFVGICHARSMGGGGVGRWKMEDGRGRGRKKEGEGERERSEGFWAGACGRREGEGERGRERKRERVERDGDCQRRAREIERGRGIGDGGIGQRWPEQGTGKERGRGEESRGEYFGYFWKCG
ncbi:hypothetical protein AAC387_Pa01g0608 [Persea americana]